jgi:hypothetical protein
MEGMMMDSLQNIATIGLSILMAILSFIIAYLANENRKWAALVDTILARINAAIEALEEEQR